MTVRPMEARTVLTAKGRGSARRGARKRETKREEAPGPEKQLTSTDVSPAHPGLRLKTIDLDLNDLPFTGFTFLA